MFFSRFNPLCQVVLRGSLSVLFLAGTPLQALTLNEYLEQVQNQGKAYQGSVTQAEGARLKSREADLYFTPQLFAEARLGYDSKLSSPALTVYDRVETQNFKLGFSQQFSFGLQGKLYYEVTEMDFVGANFGPTVLTEYWDTSPKLELSLPLLGGGFGRSARASQELARQQALAESYSSSAQSLQMLAAAEAAYWKLAAWQEVVKIQEKALKAAQEIQAYVSRKQSMNLGEKSDVIQAQALVESRTLELQMIRNEAAEALRSFNKLRQVEPSAQAEDLQSVDLKALEALEVPKNRPGDRWDVKATEAQLVSAKAASTLVQERNRATLDLAGTYAMNGRDEKLNEAITNAGTSQRDTAFVGLRFNMPLNFSARAEARSGALKAEKSAELNLQYATYAQEHDWQNLTRNLSDARDNLKLLGRIEEAQKAKLENERTRLRQGRTTTYQVLLFEQDYTQAAVSRMKSAALILSLQSQLKLYNASSVEGGK